MVVAVLRNVWIIIDRFIVNFLETV